MPAVLLMQADSKGLSWATISMREMAQGRPPLDGSVRERVSLFKIKTWHRLPQGVQRSRVAAKRTFVNFGSRPEAVLEQHTKRSRRKQTFEFNLLRVTSSRNGTLTTAHPTSLSGDAMHPPEIVLSA